MFKCCRAHTSLACHRISSSFIQLKCSILPCSRHTALGLRDLALPEWLYEPATANDAADDDTKGGKDEMAKGSTRQRAVRPEFRSGGSGDAASAFVAYHRSLLEVKDAILALVSSGTKLTMVH